jgi:hypothetical protein
LVLGDLDRGAVVTLPVCWALALHQIVVKKSLRRVLERIDAMDKLHE